MIALQTLFDASPENQRGIADDLGPWVLVSPPPDGGTEWSYRTMSASLYPVTVGGEEIVLQGDWLVHGLKKDPNRPFADTVLIGRALSNDVVLRHAGVSKLHARLHRVAEGFLLEDAGSVNGTYIGDEELPSHEKRPVGDAAYLCFGTCAALLFSMETLLAMR